MEPCKHPGGPGVNNFQREVQIAKTCDPPSATCNVFLSTSLRFKLEEKLPRVTWPLGETCCDVLQASAMHKARGPGGGLLPCNRLMGMCHRMELHFHDWLDYNGVAFSIELLEGSHIFGMWG